MCVSDLMIAEIKRIIKASEIMKYKPIFQKESCITDKSIGKMTQNGP